MYYAMFSDITGQKHPDMQDIAQPDVSVHLYIFSFYSAAFPDLYKIRPEMMERKAIIQGIRFQSFSARTKDLRQEPLPLSPVRSQQR